VVDEAGIAERYRLAMEIGLLDERSKRLWVAIEARTAGRGGIAAVVRATDVSESTVRRGLEELDQRERLERGRVRRAGAGNKPIRETNPTIEQDLAKLLEDSTRGDPDSPLRWTSKSTTKLAACLVAFGHHVSALTVQRVLRSMGFSLQANRKTREGTQHPDRDAQFRYINQTAKDAIAAGEPIISVDSKKRELVGNFKAVGREWAPKGRPVEVATHDFKDKEKGHAIPHGVFDPLANEGWVTVGIDRDTSQFAVSSIRAWWQHLGNARYPKATSLTITADCGGSNSNRTRLWKSELQKLANDTGLEITVCHFPPGTSKWNAIEHRLFSFIATNWRGKPLESLEVIINLIAGTTTNHGLKVYARLDTGSYPKGIEVPDEEFAAINIHRHDFHGEWNYTIKPSVIQE
jgi:Rhodopirellula transposase DDE domain